MTVFGRQGSPTITLALPFSRVDVKADDAAPLVAELAALTARLARTMLAAALEAEADGYIEALGDEVGVDGRRLVVRNGHARPRTVSTVAGGIEIRAPRVDDGRTDPESGERMGFKSSIVPPWCRKSPK